MTAQVVLSRIQNRRGTQAQFDALYAPAAPIEQQLQPGEIGFCTDTNRVFIGRDVGTFTEITTNGAASVVDATLEFIPMSVTLPPTATWAPVLSMAFTLDPLSTTSGYISVLYSVLETGSTTTPFTKSGTLTISSSISPNPVATISTLTDSGTEINVYPDPKPDISFKAVYSGGTVQISYIHNFVSPLILRSSSIHWQGF